MKMTVTTRMGEYDSESRIEVELESQDDKKTFSIGEGETEDMYLFRDLSDALKVPDIIRMAYEAGKAGEELEIVEHEVKYGEDE